MPVNRTPTDFNPSGNSGRIRYDSTYHAIVKRVDDAQKMGRLGVWIPEIGGDPKDPSSWITVGYASPFFGATDYRLLQANSLTEDGSQKSYGWWAVPPDVDNEVLVCFVNGDIARGYWFACVPQQFMNHMVPGIAANLATDPTYQNKNWLPPVVEQNRANPTIDPINPRRPVFSPLTDGLVAEGLTTDFERGPSSTSARRESPSKVFGYLTPRGNTLHVDDNEQNEFIRLRTRGGVQVLIHETTGYVYINSKNGNAWVEISDSGVDIYSANSVSIRAEQDFNVRADRNIIFDAGANIYMQAGSNIQMAAGQTVQIGAGTNLTASAGKALALDATGNLTVKSMADIQMQANGNLGARAGTACTRDAPMVRDNAGASPTVSATEATIPAGTKLPDQIPNGATRAAGLTQTIVSQMPTHEPWVGHARRDIPNAQGEVQQSYASGVIPRGEGDSVVVPPSAANPQRCNMGTPGQAKSMSNAAYNAFQEAAGKTGLDIRLLMAVGDRESGFNPAAQNQSSQGLMQIQGATFAGLVHQYGAQDNVAANSNFDTRSSILMGARYLQQSQANLQRNGIANPTPGQIYSGYFLGPGGQATFARALASNPGAYAADVLPTAAKANHSVFYNPDGSKKTLQQVSDSLDQDITGRMAAYNGYRGASPLPPPCGAPSGTSTTTGSGVPAVASGYQKYLGQSVGSGQCVALVRQAGNMPPTHTWSEGSSVVGNGSLVPGTVIATFDSNGTYGNHTDGTSHAAIYLGTTPDGIQVMDQWSGQPAHIRTIRYNNSASPVNNAYMFHVVQTPGQSSTVVPSTSL